MTSLGWRKSLGTLGKARLAKHRLGSQNSMHHDLEMIVTCDVRCVTGKTCCRMISKILTVSTVVNPLPSEGSENLNSLRHRDIESRRSWCQTQTFCSSVGRWPPLSGRAVCTFKLTESDVSLERCSDRSACDIVWYRPVLDSGITVLRRVDHLVMLFTCFTIIHSYHLGWLSTLLTWQVVPFFSQAVACPWMGQHSKAAGTLPLPWLQAMHFAYATRWCFESLGMFCFGQFESSRPFASCEKRKILNLLNAGSATWWKHVNTSYASPSGWRDSCGEKLPTLCPAMPRRETQHLGEFCWPSWIVWQKTYNGLDGNSYMEVSMMDRDWSKDWFWIYWGQTIQWIMKSQKVPIIYSGNLCRLEKLYKLIQTTTRCRSKCCYHRQWKW